MSRYPLAAPLGIRSREEEAAKAALGVALAWESSCRQDRDSRACALEDAGRRRREEIERLAGGSNDGGEDLGARARFVERLRTEVARLAEALRASEVSLESAVAEVDDRRRALAAARAARRALERHRDDWLAARARARRRREQDALDDAFSGRRAAP